MELALGVKGLLHTPMQYILATISFPLILICTSLVSKLIILSLYSTGSPKIIIKV
jgi:hypothetical protein